MWKKVAFNVFQRFKIDVYILYKKNNRTDLKTRLRFVEDVIDALAKEYKDAARFQSRPYLQMLYNQRFKNSEYDQEIPQSQTCFLSS